MNKADNLLVAVKYIECNCLCGCCWGDFESACCLFIHCRLYFIQIKKSLSLLIENV